MFGNEISSISPLLSSWQIQMLNFTSFKRKPYPRLASGSRGQSKESQIETLKVTFGGSFDFSFGLSVLAWPSLYLTKCSSNKLKIIPRIFCGSHGQRLGRNSSVKWNVKISNLSWPIIHFGGFFSFSADKNIATGETSQAITPFHLFDNLNFSNFYHERIFSS